MTRPDLVSEEEIQALVDGELPEADRARVLAAVTTDPHAAMQLDECLQMRAIGHALRDGGGAAVPLARGDARSAPRRRSLARFAVSISAIAAVLAAYCVARPGADRASRSNVDRQVIAELGQHRLLEPRLSWPAADTYRPYETSRAAAAPKAEALSFELLAKLERLRDERSIFAANVLSANLERATQELDRAPDTADTWSDRAVLALLRGGYEQALDAADRALALDRVHVQALWNRALALVGLGLDRTAAATFTQLASRGEPGWSQEAARRASVLVEQRARRVRDWQEATTAATAMVRGGRPALEHVDAFGALVRLHFYDAVRAAPSAERVQELAPLARSLDARFGGDILAGYVARVAAQPFAQRAALARRYAELVAGTLPQPHVAPLMRELRADGRATEDILLGALLFAGPVRGSVSPADLAEYTRLAEATRDPWFALLAKEQRARAALNAGDIAGAASELRAAAAACAGADAIAYRCELVARLETHVYFVMHRVRATREAWARSRSAALATGIIPVEDETLRVGAAVAKLRDDIGGRWLGLTRAYLDEWSSTVTDCARKLTALEEIAQSLVNQNRVADAKALVATQPHCDAPVTVQRAFLLAHLAASPREIEALRRDIATLRATATPGELALLDHIEGRALLTSAPDQARALLRRAITTGRDPQQLKARGYSYAVLAQDAGRRGAWNEMLALLAEERGAAPPERCALGAVEEEAAAFVARGRDGTLHGAYIPLAVGQAPGDVAVPANLRAALQGCDVVDVFARQPYYGRAHLLGPGIAVRFRSGLATPRTPAAGPVVVIGNVVPPPDLHLSPLQPMMAPPGASFIEGAAATPSRVLAAMRSASFVEVHAHSLTGVADDDAAVLVLSPDSDGRYALTATDFAGAELASHPVVILAACEAGSTAPSFHAAWGLADAILAAGASAVIASPSPIGDAAAPRFFASVRARVLGGRDPASALHDERNEWTDPAYRAWIDQLVVFE